MPDDDRNDTPRDSGEIRPEPVTSPTADPAPAPLPPAGKPEPATEKPRRSRIPGVLLALAVGAALVILALALGAYLVFWRGPVDAADRMSAVAVERAEELRQYFSEIAGDVSRQMQFTPRVVLNERVIIESRRQIAELATHEETFTHEFTWEHEWLRSTKRIKLRGTFTAKAGFDLETQEISIFHDEQTGETTINIPQAQILSVENRDMEILQDKDGLWNRITDEDREKAYNALLESAREAAETQEARRRAEESLLDRMEGIVQHNQREFSEKLPQLEQEPDEPKDHEHP